MITAVVSTVTYIPFTLLDLAGDPVTGKVNADFTKSAYLVSTPATTATATVTENASGTYRISFTPTVVGIWHCTWSVTVDGETVRYEETVQVVTAAQSNPVQYLAGSAVTVTSPVASSGDISLIRGDDYGSAESRAIEWNLTGAPDLTGATVAVTITIKTDTLTKAGTISQAGESTQVVSVDLTDTETAAFNDSTSVSVGTVALVATLANGHIVTLADGTVRIRSRLA